jgi:hypothetical protein
LGLDDPACCCSFPELQELIDDLPITH